MRHLMKLTIMLAALLSYSVALADEVEIGEHISIELNTAETRDGSCALTFVVINGHAAPVEQAVYETVLFTKDGSVDRLTLFDFGTLPAGRQRVRQFAVPDLGCDRLGQVLFNGASTCTAPALQSGACEAGLAVSTRTDIKVTG